MNHHLHSGMYGAITFRKGFPPGFAKQRIPQALAFHASGPWGLILYQEVDTGICRLRHFLFKLKETLSFSLREKNEGLQSLLAIEGSLQYGVSGLREFTLRKEHFILLDAGNEEATLTVNSSQDCVLLNTYYYRQEAYERLLPLFPAFRTDLKKAESTPLQFVYPPKEVRFSVHDAVETIWLDRYVALLEKMHIQMITEKALFTYLAQSYYNRGSGPTTSAQDEKSHAARDLAVQNITVPVEAKEIAKTLHCSEGWLRKTFKKVFGMGLSQYQRRVRMKKARELLLHGKTVQEAADAVGMSAQDFPKMFKRHFGYTVTELRRGLK